MNTPGGIETLGNLSLAYEGLVHNRITSEEFKEIFCDSEENPREHATALISELKNRAFASIISTENWGWFDELESYYDTDLPFHKKLEWLMVHHDEYINTSFQTGDEGQSFEGICESISHWHETPEDIAELENIFKKNPKKLQEFLAIYSLGVELWYDPLSTDITDIENSVEVFPTLCAKFAHYALSDDEFNLLLNALSLTSKVDESQRYTRVLKEIFCRDPLELKVEVPQTQKMIRALFKAIRLQNPENFVHPYWNQEIKIESKGDKAKQQAELDKHPEDAFSEKNFDFIEAQSAVVRWKWTREQINLVEQEFILDPTKLDFFLHLYAHRSDNSPEAKLEEARRIFSVVGLDYDKITNEVADKATGILDS